MGEKVSPRQSVSASYKKETLKGLQIRTSMMDNETNQLF